MPGPITIPDSGYCQKDSDEILVYQFDYDARNLAVGVELTGAGTFLISPVDQVTPLVKDNEVLVTGNRKTSVRLSGGVIGRRYTVINRVVTNETPPQTKEKRFTLGIKS